MSGYDLNALVEMGKEDVLQFVQKNLYSAVSRDGEGASIYSMFFLSMKKQPADLDIVRTRALIIQENENFLSEVSSNDPHLVGAMARAAGRISQMAECFAAIGRIELTHDEADGALYGDVQSLKSFLEGLEKLSVRLSRNASGAFQLAPLTVYKDASGANLQAVTH